MTFAQQMEAFAKKTNNKIEDVVGAVCFQLSESIVLRTPVDTGRARANWIPSLNNVSRETSDETDKTDDASPTLNKVKPFAEKSAGKIFYLINNLPYIKVLEYGKYGTGPGATIKTTRDGYSIQAPYGMVRISTIRFRQALKKAIK